MVTDMDKVAALSVIVVLSTLGMTVSAHACKGRSYNRATHICCGGTLHNAFKNSKRVGCCQERTYIPEDEECCGANVEAKTRVEGMLCCNGTFYGRSSEQLECCTKNKHLTGGLLYNTAKHHCCVDGPQVVRLHALDQSWIMSDSILACCDDQMYDMGVKSCLKNGSLVETAATETMGVCPFSSKSYDTQRELCCEDGSVIDKPAEDNEQSLKEGPTRYVCKSGIAIRDSIEQVDGDRRLGPGVKTCGKDHYTPIYDGTVSHCCDGTLKYSKVSDTRAACCGKHLYFLDDDHDCCNNEVTDRRLGYSCCNGEKYFIGSHSCCNNMLMENSKEVCCIRTHSKQWIIPKAQQNHTACCNNVSYNQMDMECVPNKFGGGAKLFPRFKDESFKQLKEDLVNLGVRKGPNDKSSMRHAENTCPFKNCGLDMTLHDWGIHCVKRNGYAMFLHNVSHTDKGMIFTAYLVAAKISAGNPRRRLEPHHITVTTPYQCSCFKPGSVYWMYTNRPSWFRRRRLVFNAKDVIVHEDSSFQCDIDRWAKKGKRASRRS